MINPNGDNFMEKDPIPTTDPVSDIPYPGEASIPSDAESRFRKATRDASTVASDTWGQTKEKVGNARERAEFFLRENPVPTVIGALGIGLAIGLAIRYASREKEEVKTPLGNIDWSVLSLPFLWPFVKSVREKLEDSTDAVKDGMGRLKKVDVKREVKRYSKPIRKRWNAWRD